MGTPNCLLIEIIKNGLGLLIKEAKNQTHIVAQVRFDSISKLAVEKVTPWLEGGNMLSSLMGDNTCIHT